METETGLGEGLIYRKPRFSRARITRKVSFISLSNTSCSTITPKPKFNICSSNLSSPNPLLQHSLVPPALLDSFVFLAPILKKMNWRWKEEYSDLILVPIGLIIMFSYHLFLLYRYLKFPHTTVMGCEDHYKRVWVEKTMQLDAKERGTAIAVINSSIIASTNMSSVSLVLSSLIGTWIGSPSGKSILSSSVIYGDTRMTITSYKYITLLSCFLVAFASFVQMLRNYTLAAFLISMPHCEIPVSCVQKPVIKGSNYWVIGLRALYFAATLIMWIFGPISMFISSVIMVVVLHNLDTSSTEPYLFRSHFRHHNFRTAGEELVTINRAFGHEERTM